MYRPGSSSSSSSSSTSSGTTISTRLNSLIPSSFTVSKARLCPPLTPTPTLAPKLLLLLIISSADGSCRSLNIFLPDPIDDCVGMDRGHEDDAEDEGAEEA